MSAYEAQDGLLGAKDILLGNRGIAKGMAFGKHDPSKLVKNLGQDWKVTETSFKVGSDCHCAGSSLQGVQYWASCRHTHPSADALLAVMQRHKLQADDIESVTAKVYSPAIDVLGPAAAGRTIHESKFSMGFVLGVIAINQRAMLGDFTEAALKDERIRSFQNKVTMKLDDGIDKAYPDRWVRLYSLRQRQLADCWRTPDRTRRSHND